jgi:hypothetical protein
MTLSLALPSPGSLAPNNPVDPLRYYYVPVIGRIFRARIDLGLALLAGPYRRLLEVGFGSGLLLPTLARIAGRVDGIDLESDPDDVRGRLSALGVTVGDLARGRPGAALPGRRVRLRRGVLDPGAPEGGPAGARRGGGAPRDGPERPFLVGCPAIHKAMNVGFRAIGFRGIEDHHFSSIHDILAAVGRSFEVRKVAKLPSLAPLGWAPYSAVLLGASG